MPNALVPELAVADWQVSRRFYCELLGFEERYQRPGEGFSYLALGQAELMIDQIGLGRTFEHGHAPQTYPFGKGVNLQVRVQAVAPILQALEAGKVELYLPLEERWYAKDAVELGHRQFVVADPDGYLLRFYEDLGRRPTAMG